jgi:hypothetical protein
MDYSLLLGVEEIKGGARPESRNGALVSQDGNYVYHFSIIDFLATFKFKK